MLKVSARGQLASSRNSMVEGPGRGSCSTHSSQELGRKGRSREQEPSFQVTALVTHLFRQAPPPIAVQLQNPATVTLLPSGARTIQSPSKQMRLWGTFLCLNQNRLLYFYFIEMHQPNQRSTTHFYSHFT